MKGLVNNKMKGMWHEAAVT